jgi:P-type Ca2+ transporter type 2C
MNTHKGKSGVIILAGEYIKGLSNKEAGKRLLKYGKNIISEGRKIPVLKLFFDQFRQLIVLILIAATILSIFLGEMVEAFAIMAIVILNAFMGFIQEYRTEKTMEALRKLSAPIAKVIRDGNETLISADVIVPGDLILIEAGDRIPADAILVESYALTVDESLLTGESVSVEKKTDDLNNNIAGEFDRKSSVYMGTIATTGRGKAFVNATGMDTEMGKIAGMINDVQDVQTPLQAKLEYLGRYIVYGALIICAIVSLTGILRGEDIFTMFLAGVSLAVAAIPEGLPAVVTIALAIGVQRMLKKNALVRKLPAVETLGCASVICSDKTGTLTQNKMTVSKIFTLGKIFDMKDRGIAKNLTAEMVLKTGSLCSNTTVFKDSKSGEWETRGDPTEAAILVAAANQGITKEKLDREYKRVDEIPFDPEKKYMTVMCRDKKEKTYLFTKGAADVVCKMCKYALYNDEIKDMSDTLKHNILAANDSMARNALRVIAMAYKVCDSSIVNTDDAENGLVFAGMTGMYDPPRKEAADAVLKCRLSGIKPVMITGDHRETASAIAKETGILQRGDIIMTGLELDRIDKNKFLRKVENTSVYARVSPRHKLDIVRALKRLGHIVAMTGDGVNDAPAVREADIGISMGISGTDVTKEASAMILMDDNFSTIVAAVEEGRVIYNNIRKFIRYLLSCNIGEVLTMFIGMLIGLPVVLLPIQILWVNLVTDGLPAIALGLEPGEKDLMRGAGRNPKDSIFSGGLTSLIIFRGILIAISTLAVFVSVQYFTGNLVLSRTAAFVTLVMAQLMHVFECKSEKRTLLEIPFFNNIFLIFAVACSTAMILAVVYLPFLQPVFKTAALSINEWAFVIGFSSLGPMLSGIFRKR